MSTALGRPDLISLAAGFTDNATLPVDQVRQVLGEVLSSRKRGEPALQYGSTTGLPELRRLTAERLDRLEQAAGASGSAASGMAEQLVITHGSQQLLYMLTEVLCDPGDIVLVEDPTYFVLLGIAQSRGIDCRGLKLEADGVDLKCLDNVLGSLKRGRRLGRVKLIYLITYHQNPTSTTTSFAKKVGVLDLLRCYEKMAGHPIYLIEDATYRELGFQGLGEASALAARGARARVVYAGTYSKSFATGVRVGFGALPEAILAAVLRVKGNHDFGTANLLQHMLARALTSGCYDVHLAELRHRYAQKAGWMISALRAHFPAQVQWREPTGGMYVWAALPRKVKTGLHSRLFRTALDRDVLYVPGQLCYAPDTTRARPDHEMRLSYGNATRQEIDVGIRRLGSAIKQSLSRPCSAQRARDPK